MNFVAFQFRIRYETRPGEEIYIYGDCPDFGNWKQPKFKLRWSHGHIWRADYHMSKSSKNIKFKFVCHSKTSNKWEEGENRLLSPNNLNGLAKTFDGKYILDCVWNHFKINFNIHYIPSNPKTFMQVVGSPDALSNWQKVNEPVKMELQNDKEITAKDGNKITGFWTVTALMRNSDKRNLDFEYRYSLFDPKSGTAIWEREPNRHLHFFLNEEEMASFEDPKLSPDSCFLLTNSFLEILDVNFVANLVFNKMGDKKIYIGPYPQSENDFKVISECGIDSILNVQSEKDLIFRQINHQLQLKQAKSHGLTIYRYPIEDFSQQDLLDKLKGAGDLLNKLLKEGKTVYVHCTAGMSRAAATVIIYLVLYDNFNVENAYKFCKEHRPVICPNSGVINKIASIYKPGSEMSDGSVLNFTPSLISSKVNKQVDKENEKEIAREKERRRIIELKKKERLMKEQKLREQKERERMEENQVEEEPKKKIVKMKVKVKKKVKTGNKQKNENDKIIEERNKLNEIMNHQNLENDYDDKLNNEKIIEKKKIKIRPKKKIIEDDIYDEEEKEKEQKRKIRKKIKISKDNNIDEDKKVYRNIYKEKVEEPQYNRNKIKKRKIIKIKKTKNTIENKFENNEDIDDEKEEYNEDINIEREDLKVKREDNEENEENEDDEFKGDNDEENEENENKDNEEIENNEEIEEEENNYYY